MTALARLADALDAFSRALGNAVKWLAVLLVLVQFVVVILRYIYGSSFIWMQESVIYIHAALFMLAIAYTLLRDAHVRVDLYYGAWRPTTRAAVDLAGILIGVLPFCWLLIWASWTWAMTSWRMGEGPLQVGGLPLTPLLKAMVPGMAILLALQSVSVLIRCVVVIAGRTPTHFPHAATIEKA
jgi:TRAP-type mannitol/chloroaromatic compound transport system permease small subunit